MAEAVHPRAYRPYRVTAYVLYIVVAGTGSLLFLGSIVRDLRSQAQAASGAKALFVAGKPLAKDAYLTCVDHLGDLHDSLGARFAALPEAAARRGSAALDGWQDFSRRWQARLEGVATACGIGSATGKRATALGDLYDRLVDLQRAYATEATRLLREDGDTIQSASAAFRATRHPPR